MIFVTRIAQSQKQLLLAFWNHHFRDAYTIPYLIIQPPLLTLFTKLYINPSKPPFPPLQNGKDNRA